MSVDVIEPLPFQPPSHELLGLLRALKESQRRIERIAAWSVWQHEELLALGELPPAGIDALLSGRAR